MPSFCFVRARPDWTEVDLSKAVRECPLASRAWAERVGIDEDSGWGVVFCSQEVELLARCISDNVDGDVLAIEWHPSVGALGYWRYSQTRLVRGIENTLGGEEGIWNRVVGTPEAWERSFFFTTAPCADDLEFAPELVELAWSKRLLVEGIYYPMSRAEDVIGVLISEFNMPGQIAEWVAYRRSIGESLYRFKSQLLEVFRWLGK